MMIPGKPKVSGVKGVLSNSLWPLVGGADPSPVIKLQLQAALTTVLAIVCLACLEWANIWKCPTPLF